jgi:hypothetical protein
MLIDMFDITRYTAYIAHREEVSTMVCDICGEKVTANEIDDRVSTPFFTCCDFCSNSCVMVEQDDDMGDDE